MIAAAALVLLLPSQAAPAQEPPPTVPPSRSETTASPTATPAARDPKLVASLEAVQGDAFERTALFDDGTLVHSVRYKGRTLSTRKALSAEEVDVVRKVCADALLVREPSSRVGGVLGDAGGRVLTVEVADPKGGSRRFTSDDLSSAPLAVGRARDALGDLRARFFAPDPRETSWDPSRVKVRDLLRQRDGRWFRVVRAETFLQERNLELEEVGGLEHLFVLREDVPKLFEDPEKISPAERTPRPEAKQELVVDPDHRR